MSEIIYNPEDAGTELIDKKGKIKKIRKYHMTDEEMIRSKEKWLEEVKNVDKRIKKKAHKHFFNPYRKGIYYYQIQTLYLLGANEWHSLSTIISKLEEYTSNILLNNAIIKETGYKTAWEKFRGKSSRSLGQKCKDYIGRIQENFVFFQRLSMSHPSGYKLYQARAAVDIKRINKTGFEQGAFFYKLSTYNSMKKALPIKDFSRFTFPKHEGRYISYKFIGTIVTKDKIIKGGVLL